MKLAIAICVVAILVIAMILFSRRRSILSSRGRNRHFAKLSRKFGLKTTQDSYFIQMEGEWQGTKVWVHPHNFEGPGSITLFYADTGVPLRDRTWIEPTLSLGRAIVDWKSQHPFGFEITGDTAVFGEAARSAMRDMEKQYPYVAITLPSRFLFSPLLMRSLEAWPNFVAFLALDAGRKPSRIEVQKALDAIVALCRMLTQ